MGLLDPFKRSGPKFPPRPPIIAIVVMASLTLSGCADAKTIADEAKGCEKAAEEPRYPQEALVAKFDEVSRKAKLADEQGFSRDAAAANFASMSDSDARAMFWAICLGEKGSDCTDPERRPDGSLAPPRVCSVTSGELSSNIDNPFLDSPAPE